MCKVAGPMLTSSSPPPSPKSKKTIKPKKEELVKEEKKFKNAKRNTFWHIKMVNYQKNEN